MPRVNRFDAVLMVDWSARHSPAPRRPSRDAIWLCLRTAEHCLTEYCRTRIQAEAMIRELLVSAPGRVLAGFDFSFALPAWAMQRFGGWRNLWSGLESAPVEENRFAVAARLNELLGTPAFWGAPQGQNAVPHRRPAHGQPEYRLCELRLPVRPQSSFKLYTAGAVGSQMLLGLPVLERLRRRFGRRVAVWPFEPWSRARIVLAEVYPSLLGKPPAAALPDRWRVETLSAHYLKQGALLRRSLPAIAREEGWVLDLALD